MLCCTLLQINRFHKILKLLSAMSFPSTMQQEDENTLVDPLARPHSKKHCFSVVMSDART